jgi:hypothetical protein
MKVIRKNQSTRGKTCPSATSSTTNPTRIDASSNPGLRGEKPAANRLSHGAAYRYTLEAVLTGLVDRKLTAMIECIRKEILQNTNLN